VTWEVVRDLSKRFIDLLDDELMERACRTSTRTLT
jgi:hypothetical protein